MLSKIKILEHKQHDLILTYRLIRMPQMELDWK